MSEEANKNENDIKLLNELWGRVSPRLQIPGVETVRDEAGQKPAPTLLLVGLAVLAALGGRTPPTRAVSNRSTTGAPVATPPVRPENPWRGAESIRRKRYTGFFVEE